MTEQTEFGKSRRRFLKQAPLGLLSLVAALSGCATSGRKQSSEGVDSNQAYS